jgi:hypothetical protein
MSFDWAGDIEIVWTFIRECKYMKVVVSGDKEICR